MGSRDPVDDLSALLNNLGSGSFDNNEQREQVKQALFDAHRRLQTPWDIASDHVFAQPVTTAAIRTLIEAGFWQKWLESGKKGGSVEELADVGGIDAALLKRLLRQLAGQGLIEETSLDTFTSTPFTQALGGDKFPSLYQFLHHINQPGFANFPAFAQKTGYRNPINLASSNFQDWRGSEETVFAFLGTRPELATHFNNSMTVYASAKASWTSIYPVEEIIHNAKEDRALVVDVAGGVGHDLEKFRKIFPFVPQGSLILQDLPKVIVTAQIQEPCTAQAHDIFSPQPVEGAQVYYLHMILHDWSNEKAAEILKHLAEAGEKGYSKILIHEKVVADFNATANATVSDLTMMMTLSSLERSESQWRELVGKAGLEIAKIWTKPGATECVIEIQI